MIVRAIYTTGDALPSYANDKARGVTAGTQFAVSLGRTYVVFGVTLFLGIAWYYVLDDDGHDWPTWIPAALFEVVDGNIPKSWVLGYFRFSRDDQYPLLSFPEWATDHHFYERLVARDPDAMAVFSRRRAEIEAANS